MDGITTADVMAVLSPIWNSKPPTARRVRQRIGTVMEWAIAQGYHSAGEALGAALPKQGGIQRHFKELPFGEVAGAGPDGAAIRGSRRGQARLRVSDADGVPVGGDARSAVGGNRLGGGYLDGSSRRDEAQAGAPGAVYEKGETQSFYNAFFEIFGVRRRSVARYEEHVRGLDNRSGFIDLFWPGVLIVEQKSAGRDLGASPLPTDRREIFRQPFRKGPSALYLGE